MNKPLLSICIATYNRGKFIGETLDSILPQLDSNIELIVVNGASPDNTHDVLTKYVKLFPQIKYFSEVSNSGVDIDYDKAVLYSTGTFCWLMTDDDLLHPCAISKILKSIRPELDLIIVNGELRNTDLSTIIQSSRVDIKTDKEYNLSNKQELFSEMASYLAFIGCVVIRRDFWLQRNRSEYYGSLFIHVGVIFQSPSLKNAMFLSDPLIIIRHGNSMWTPRSFEIWMFKWPELIWSFTDFSDESKRKVCRREPWRSMKALFNHRAFGSYTLSEYEFFKHKEIDKFEKYNAFLISIFPSSIANIIMVFYYSLVAPLSEIALYDLLHSKTTNWISLLTAKILKIKG